jgi:branched-chain amino acid transport system permease protein
MALGGAMLIELTYHVTLDAGQGSVLSLFGFPMDTSAAGPWAFAATVLLSSLAAFAFYRRGFRRSWEAIQQEIENSIRDNPA